MLDAESLAYWYLRLNGFLTLPNVIIHPDRGVGIKTDVDALGARFPHRRELLEDPMEDDPLLVELAEGKILIVLGEAKTNFIDINKAWRRPERRNIERILGLVGPFPQVEVGVAAEAIYERGWYADAQHKVSLLAFGSRTNVDLERDLPEVPQITWARVAAFVHERFYIFKNQKRLHDQWPDGGKALWRIFLRHADDLDGFTEALLHTCGLGREPV